MEVLENGYHNFFEEERIHDFKWSHAKFDWSDLQRDDTMSQFHYKNGTLWDEWKTSKTFTELMGGHIDKSLILQRSKNGMILDWSKLQEVTKDKNRISWDLTYVPRPPLSTLVLRVNLCQLINLLGSAIAEFSHLIVNIPLSFLQGLFSPFIFAQEVSLSFLRSLQNYLSERSCQIKRCLSLICNIRHKSKCSARTRYACLQWALMKEDHWCIRLVDRIKSTLRGSADDIGWLQRIPDLPPVTDKTDRFLQLLGLVSDGIHKLPNSYVYLLVPGLFSNHGPLYFVDTKKYFSKLGVTCHIAKIHSEASVETNALEIKNYIEELYWGCGKRVMLLGHSKGGVDAAAAIAKYWSHLREKVAGLVVVQSPYGGSPIASDIFREGQIADVETRRVMEVIICRIIKGDIRSLEDLTYDKRRDFLAKYPLPIDFPTVSFHTEVSIAPGVLYTMSHIAHAELPWLPLSAFCGANLQESTPATKLPVIIPLAAAMAVCALHLDLRYGEKSDGLVVRKDAEIPGSVVVRPDRKLDHAWMVYSRSRKGAQESDASQMCEALLTLLLEEAQLYAAEDE